MMVNLFNNSPPILPSLSLKSLIFSIDSLFGNATFILVISKLPILILGILDRLPKISPLKP